MNAYQPEFEMLDDIFCYVAGDPSKKDQIPIPDNQPVHIAALLLQVAHVFPSLSLTITPEQLWEWRVGPDTVRHYQFRHYVHPRAYLRSILARIGFLISEAQDEILNRAMPPPIYLQNYLHGTTRVPAMFEEKARNYLALRESEAQRLGIKEVNLYGFTIERIHTDEQGNQWIVTIETQNNMTKGPIYLKMSSKPYSPKDISLIQ